MKTDINATSTTRAGEEQWEFYTNSYGEKRIQYDYRTQNGQLFSCTAINLQFARIKRDLWVEKHHSPKDRNLPEERYTYYETLGELRTRVENTIAKYGPNAKYALTGCYGAEGRIINVYKADNEPLIYFETDICSG